MRTPKHTPQWELSSKHRDEQYIDEPLAEELRPLFRIHWDNNVSDTEAEQGATLIAAAPAMYEALKALVEVFPSVVKMTPYGVPMSISKIHDNAVAALAQAEGKP